MKSPELPDGRIRLGTAGLTLELDPRDGGKVTRLRCERHGREWLHGPPDVEAAGAPDDYDASRSWGWDELFPTVLTTTGAPSPWPSVLRDHGELWGRPWLVEEVAPRSATLRFADPGGRFGFVRALVVDGPTVLARYELRNLLSRPLPFLWAMHPIFSVEPGDRLELPDVRSVAATHLRPQRLPAVGSRLDWPVADVDGAAVRLDRIAPVDGETAIKVFAGPPHPPVARLIGRPCGLEIRPQLPFVGIYVNRGGWPRSGSDLHQVGIEPTTSPADDLTGAVAARTHRVLGAGGVASWHVHMELIHPSGG